MASNCILLDQSEVPPCPPEKLISRYDNHVCKKKNMFILKKQGWIHSNPVADSWAGAVMQKPLAIQKCDGRTDRHGKE